MTKIAQKDTRNKLLRRLPEEAFDLIASDLKRVDLPVRRSLVEPNQPIEHVCFIESGLASMVAVASNGIGIEVGQIGYEGMSGYPVVLGVDRMPNRAFMQISGVGLELPTSRFLPLLRDEATRLMFLRYVHTRELQLAYSALAAGRYNMHQRLARWLLMCHDRLLVDDMPVTHEFLALMLGVRRSGVTDHLHILEGMRAIKSTRGNVKILDRQILLDVADGCYGAPEAEYERLLGYPSSDDQRPARLKGAWGRWSGSTIEHR
ncbi:Crp/Fnr family transcriptional regulator [Rhizobium sp. CNPSo 3490]|uniref:Crp/Fnr family transcriptional regulator n=1 Tax=Rhizobium sp. CNPSo 3490 TaxID=3021407 RepID=UPI00254BA536|nr:Crp/Fnr family transcriptional regulator [Rhizobium sp. CNPSo 3490]MDK4735837.1 Crp/Fnr family transcriptional regulator [Rhizobium sp. CNPSo 3490]